MRIANKYLNELTYQVIGCAIEVHKHLGPVYWKAFMRNVLRELNLRGLANKKPDLGTLGVQRLAS